MTVPFGPLHAPNRFFGACVSLRRTRQQQRIVPRISIRATGGVTGSASVILTRAATTNPNTNNTTANASMMGSAIPEPGRPRTPTKTATQPRYPRNTRTAKNAPTDPPTAPPANAGAPDNACNTRATPLIGTVAHASQGSHNPPHRLRTGSAQGSGQGSARNHRDESRRSLP